jgi:SAM-dependent methyltransferase
MTTDQTGNGFAFQIASSEKGVSPYAVLEAAWCLPAIIHGIRNKIWSHPYDTRLMPHPVLVLWAEMGLLEVHEQDDDTAQPVLTQGGEDIVKLGELFEYEFSMMLQQLEGDYTTKPEKYRSLRKALACYTDLYLQPLVDWIWSESEHYRILDFGGGDGYILRKLLEASSNTSSGVLFDKAPSLEAGFLDNLSVELFTGDFLAPDNSFVKDHPHQFDTIVFSEVMHCLGPLQYDIVLSQLAKLLTPGGRVFVIEQHQNFRLNWRMHDMTKGGMALTPDMVRDVFDTMTHLGLQTLEQRSTATHHVTVLKHLEASNVKPH